MVGGFLGAGKTTLILAAARELQKRGLRSAVILNDQGESLVDTQQARQQGIEADEVTGGCFCCQFASLMESVEALRAHSPDVIFAEPVGSCTDTSATVLQPLREMHAGEYRLAPFTVCVDPARQVEGQPHLRFLFENQIAEADLVLYTKSDLQAEAPAGGRYVSALTGQGVAAWLDEILFGQIAAGSRTLDIDYSEYARAEAALAWLNLSATIECAPPVSPAMVLGPLMDEIAGGLNVVHLKATDQCESGFLKAAVCSRGEEPQVEGALDASPASRHEVLVNLRSAGEPAVVRAVVEAALARVAGRVVEMEVACFTPGAPRRPTWDQRTRV